MSQVARQICEIAIRELGLNRIKANVFSPNVASQRVLHKNGFMLKENYVQRSRSLTSCKSVSYREVKPSLFPHLSRVYPDNIPIIVSFSSLFR